MDCFPFVWRVVSHPFSCFIAIFRQFLSDRDKIFIIFRRKVLATSFFQEQVFIYSRPIAGIRAKIEHETTYLQTSKWHVKNIHVFMHLGFKYHTDQRA